MPLLLLLPLTVHALEPSEVVLVVNKNGLSSEAVAQRFAQLRGIPANRIIRLDVPPLHRSTHGQLSRKDFVEKIWQPLGEVVLERGLNKETTTVIYSTDFPVAVTTSPITSITGMTFLAGNNPGAELIKSGNMASPFFAGPIPPSIPPRKAETFAQLHDRHSAALPPASMMLGFTGPRGMHLEEVLYSLERSRQADFSQPNAPIYAIDVKDVRSKTRRNQLAPVKDELAILGKKFVVQSSWPDSTTRLGGLLTGMSIIPEFREFRLGPGSAADHLTSFAGHFYSPLQTKCTQWIRQGAAASCGTVTEPYAIWTKFPHARFYTHYARGLTALEAYMASVACPLQLLLLGDPLAQPYAKGIPPEITVRPRPTFSSTEKMAADHLSFEQLEKFSLCFPGQWKTEKAPRLRISGKSKRLFTDQGFTGIVFNYLSPEDFDFFGIHGYSGFWMIGSRSNGGWTMHEVWGEPIFVNQTYTLALEHTEDGYTGSVNDRITCSWQTKKEPEGKLGISQSTKDSFSFQLLNR